MATGPEKSLVDARVQLPAGRHSGCAAAMAVVFALSFVVSALPTLLWSMPQPNQHDEFSYLLAADTFARGRVTNPPHPMWRHFETFHVIHRPTYSSKYPPAQGLALAAGQLLWRPILGVWLSTAAACAAVTWMLRACFSARWALVGGVLMALLPVVHQWSQIYMGGGVAMLGGALLGGACLRIITCRDATRRESSADARRMASRLVGFGLIAGIGAVILANSRPFEGLLLCLLVALLILFSTKRPRWWSCAASRVAPPLACVLLAGAMAMAYFNWRVTDNPMKLPYVEHARQYAIAPFLFWQKPNVQQQHRHAIMRAYYYNDDYVAYLRQMSFSGLVREAGVKAARLARTYLAPWPMAIIALAGLAAAARSRRARWAVAICVGLPVLELLCAPIINPVYMSPAVGFLALLAVMGLRRLDVVRIRGWRVGRYAVGVLLLLQLGLSIWRVVTYAQSRQNDFGTLRASFVESLAAQPGRQLVIVRYEPRHNYSAEWVFNSADIDAQQIVFARDLGPDQNRALLDHYADRQAWLLQPESPNPLTPIGQ